MNPILAAPRTLVALVDDMKAGKRHITLRQKKILLNKMRRASRELAAHKTNLERILAAEPRESLQAGEDLHDKRRSWMDEYRF